MNYKISFRERAALAMMHLSKQLPITLETAKEQAQWLRKKHKNKAEETKKLITFAKQYDFPLAQKSRLCL